MIENKVADIRFVYAYQTKDGWLFLEQHLAEVHHRELEFEEFYNSLHDLCEGTVPYVVIKNWLQDHREHVLKFLTDSPLTIEGFKHE